jgi:hypothetical protein
MKTNATICNVPVCDRKKYANGYCEGHNKELQRHGTVQNRKLRGEISDYRINARLYGLTGQTVREVAEEKNTTPYSLVQDIIDRWAANLRRRRARTAARSTAA